MMYNLPDIYKFYRDTGGDQEYSVFSAVCQEFNQRIMDEVVLKGGKFDMGSYMSTISIIRIGRNFRKKRVNWKASLEYKQELLDQGKILYDPATGEGEKWFIYYTNDWYCRFYWYKFHAKIVNKTVYRFVASRGSSGNKDKLAALLSEDDLAYLRFEKVKD